jgi:hypothetical protein
MICALSKWFISSSLDSNKKIPGFVRNHLSKCGSCRQFLQFSQTLEDQAAKDAATVIQKTQVSLVGRMKRKAFLKPEPRKRYRLGRPLIPALSLSLVAVLVVLFFVFRPNPSPAPTPVPGSSVLAPYESFLFGRDSNPGGSLKNLASQMESPFETEWQSIQKKVKSAADSLKSRLDLKIEKREN